jgi:hypothetical protein
MTVAVIFDAVTAPNYLAHKVWMACSSSPYTEEAGFCSVTIEHLEHKRRYVWIGSVVEGEGDTMITYTSGREPR